jgi:hypothetical protein
VERESGRGQVDWVESWRGEREEGREDGHSAREKGGERERVLSLAGNSRRRTEKRRGTREKPKDCDQTVFKEGYGAGSASAKKEQVATVLLSEVPTVERAREEEETARFPFSPRSEGRAAHNSDGATIELFHSRPRAPLNQSRGVWLRSRKNDGLAASPTFSSRRKTTEERLHTLLRLLLCAICAPYTTFILV